MRRITQLIKTRFTLYRVYDFIIYIKFLVSVSSLDFLTNSSQRISYTAFYKNKNLLSPISVNVFKFW